MPAFRLRVERKFFRELGQARRNTFVLKMHETLAAMNYFPSRTIEITWEPFVQGINAAPLSLEIKLHVGETNLQIPLHELRYVKVALVEELKQLLKSGILPANEYGVCFDDNVNGEYHVVLYDVEPEN